MTPPQSSHLRDSAVECNLGGFFSINPIYWRCYMKTKVALKYQPFKVALSQHSTSTVRLLPVFFRPAFPSQTIILITSWK